MGEVGERGVRSGSFRQPFTVIRTWGGTGQEGLGGLGAVDPDIYWRLVPCHSLVNETHFRDCSH